MVWSAVVARPIPGRRSPDRSIVDPSEESHWALAALGQPHWIFGQNPYKLNWQNVKNADHPQTTALPSQPDVLDCKHCHFRRVNSRAVQTLCRIQSHVSCNSRAPLIFKPHDHPEFPLARSLTRDKQFLRSSRQQTSLQPPAPCSTPLQMIMMGHRALSL